MASEIYREALENARRELEAAIRERDRLTLEVARLQELVKSLSAASEISDEERQRLQALKAQIRAEVGLQEVVLSCIRSAPEPIGAIEIRDRIRLGQLADLSRYENSLSVIHTAIKRLHKNHQIRPVPGKKFVALEYPSAEELRRRMMKKEF